MSDYSDAVHAERAACVHLALECIKRLSELGALDPLYRADDLRQVSDAALSASDLLLSSLNASTGPTAH